MCDFEIVCLFAVDLALDVAPSTVVGSSGLKRESNKSKRGRKSRQQLAGVCIRDWRLKHKHTNQFIRLGFVLKLWHHKRLASQVPVPDRGGALGGGRGGGHEGYGRGGGDEEETAHYLN